ncbi:MAG: hypothetical protein BIFFINMI_02928 [Phycisphaerae bacterium]|nr:hypothetical protein [Phycisphaerae bacterium]
MKFDNEASEQRARILAIRPKNSEVLGRWLHRVFDLHVPGEAFCEHHCAPMDYLWAAYSQAFTDAVVWANRGGGKTTLGAIITLLDMLHRPGTRVRILGGSLDQSRRMYRYLGDMLQSRYGHRIASRSSHVGARRVELDNGSEVEILAQSQRSVRGNRVQKMRCDEVELFDHDVWTSCQLVTESRGRGPDLSRGALEAFSTMHRPGGLMQRLVDDVRRGGGRVFHWCALDVAERCTAPAGECPACPLWEDCGGRLRAKRRAQCGHVRIADLAAARRRVGRETWESEMLCLRPSRREAVFERFARPRHVRPLKCDPTLELYRAMDFGYVNPFVCLWVQVTGRGDVHVLRELVQARATLLANAARVKELDPGPVRMSYCDPSGGQADQMTGTTARGELAEMGIKTRAIASKIGDGLELIRRHLDGEAGHPTLSIDPSCVKLIAAMECYRYRTPDEGGDPATPFKDGVHDHPVDALRYFFVNHFARRAARVKVRLY